MMTTLVDRLRARAHDAARFNDMGMALHPRAIPAAEDLDALEKRLGWTLPPLLRSVLLELGDGFGPGYGLLGVHVDQAGFPAALLGQKLLPVCDWGCAIFSLADCSHPDAPIHVCNGGEPHVLDDPRTTFTFTSAGGEVLADKPAWWVPKGAAPPPSPRTAHKLHKRSLEAWLTAWVEGADLWSEMEQLG